MKHIDQTKVNRYLELQAIIKTAEDELGTIKNEFLLAGNSESDFNYIVIKENTRESVAGKRYITEKFGPNFLIEHDLLTVTHYKTVVITEKKAS